jgi:hypothetical protein
VTVPGFQPAASTSPLSPSLLDADVDREPEELEVCAAKSHWPPGALFLSRAQAKIAQAIWRTVHRLRA